MKKHLFPILLAMILSLACLISVSAAESGRCGENIQWSYDDGILTISGEGKMDDFAEDGAPWFAHREDIKEVIFEGGVTYVGAYSFADYDKLEHVDFGDAMYELGKRSFYSCDSLTSIELPASFKIFGEDSLRSCRSLTQIHCAGRFPSFRLNSLWDTYATIYFPADWPWGVEYIAQLEEAFHGRIEFIASDGTDPYDPTGSTEATESTESTEETDGTEESTEATEESTEETTEATEETAEPSTQAPTQPEPTETPAASQPPEEPREPESQSWIALVIIGAVVAFLLLGTGITMLTGSSRKKGRYAR